MSSSPSSFLIPAQPHATERSSSRSTAANRQRVLLVDDEVDVLNGLRAMLEDDGYAVTCSTNLQLATTRLQHEPYDLVVTDLYLGETQLGSDLAKVAESLRPAPPVIVLTGRPSFGGAQEALRRHVADLVVKPVETQTLLSTCRRVIQETDLTRRNRELESVNRALSAVLPRTIEIKDPTTSGHSERVVGYTDSLAKRCGVGEEDRASLRLAALLHDIGKIGIPDNILTKPGPLTTAEMDVVKLHPAMGYEVLASLDGQDDVRNWVYQHHERWDGKGYPQGLAGDAVTLPGRILVLSEVYDALAEERSYKAAWPLPKITAFFRDQAGRQFDPDLAHTVADGLDRMGIRFFSQQPNSLF